MKKVKIVLLLSSLVVGVLLTILWSNSTSDTIDFNTQVKPLLNKHCIACHGGVKQSGGLSMMTRNDVLKAGDSGKPAVVPGDPQKSELYKRLITSDEEERMPFEQAPLDKTTIKVFKKWIEQGAEWGEHWAFKSVVAVEPPKVALVGKIGANETEWASHPIDQFILKKQFEHDLKPSEEADRRTLLRRLSLDLIGMPAPTQLKEQFLDATNPLSYEQLIDSLLAAPYFGERWAAVWLDIARYADSKGAERDAHRTIWEYRDWLIRAFNADLPYNQFLTEQIAGDLLPNPTDAQYIATGFHRNTVTNDEGGTDNEEFRLAAVVDRVNTTWEGILGTTFACTQCHGHPYDPIKHEEYYSFLAFFNNSLDNDTYGDYPWLRKLNAKQQQELIELQEWVKKVSTEERAAEIYEFVKTWQPVYYSLLADSLKEADIYDTKFLGFRNNGTARLPDIYLENKDDLIFKYHGGVGEGQLSLYLDSLAGTLLAAVDVSGNSGIQEVLLPNNLTGKHDLFFRYENANLIGSSRPGIQFDWFHFTQQFPGKGEPNYDKYKALYWDLVTAKTDHTLIMVENPADRLRKTHVWDRGNWLTRTEEVTAAVPELFYPLPDDAPNNRLGLAMWLTDQRNPLTARTMVNRVWEQLFGVGLVETLEDLGTQGIPPTHPELLDYLAWQFMNDYEWSIKRLLKEIVLSATYRQSTKLNPELLEVDPMNKWYTRAPRVRLSAEQLRDQALGVSGLLSAKMFGPSVMPYQPDGVWNVPYNSQAWKLSEGEDRYRRAIYTYWKRSAPHPAMLTFDAASRQVCSARRIRTNTPLQALVTLNDITYMEAAIHLALNTLEQVNVSSVDTHIRYAYETAVGQPIGESELEQLVNLYESMRTDFEQDAESKVQLLENLEKDQQTADVAALAVTANAIMNLDEFLTKS